MPCKANIQTIVVNGFFTVTGGTAPTVVTSGPETVNPGDNLHIWSAGGLDIDVTPGSARANIEPANITSNFATPGAPAAPADPSRSAAHLAADGVYMWDVANAIWRLAGNTAASGAFVGLTDTPASYVGASGQGIRVNAGETGLEFFNVPDTWLSLNDTPVTYAGQAGFVPIVNAGETALIYADPATFDTSIYENDGALTANRTVTGSGFNMNFAGVNDFNVSGTNFSHILTGNAAITSVGDLNFVSTGGISTLGSNTRVDLAGEVRVINYLETRDDSAVDPPINFLYTEAIGDLRSAPITALNIPATVLDLTDTPAAYGASGQVLALDATGTALEWVTPTSGVTTFTALTDTPAAYAGAGLQGLRVNAGETAVEFYDIADTWLELGDTPASYVGQAGFIPQVNVAESGLQFVDPATLDTDTNIYTNDGALAGDRIVTGFGQDLTFLGMDTITVAPIDFVVNTTGNVQLTDFPNTRDDSGTLRPANTLYTDATGNLLAVPSTVISEVAAPPTAPSPFDAAVAFDTGSVPGVPIPYFWDGTAWLAFPSADNIYTADGALTADRTLTGAGNDLSFTGVQDFSLATNNRFDLSGNFASISLAGGDVDWNFDGPAGAVDMDAVTSQDLLIGGTSRLFVEAGNLIFGDYPNTRDDGSGANYLFTDASGVLQSGDIANLNIPDDILDLTDTPAVYGAVGDYLAVDATGTALEWVTPAGAGINIYNADGVVTGNRLVDGGGNVIDFNNFDDINLQALDDISLTTTTGDIFASADRVASLRSVGGTDLQFVNLLDSGFINIGWSGFSFQLQNTGDFAISSYPETRDDTATATPINFLYMDGVGVNSRLRMSPLSQLIDTSAGAPTTTPVVNGSITYDAAAGDIYGWDGAAWQILGGGASTNIYNTDDVFTANRTADLDGNDLTINGTGNIELSPSGQVLLSSGQVFLQSGGVLARVHFIDGYFFDGGNIRANQYPDSRDDTGTFAPNNFLYTGAGGELYSAPVAALPAPPADGNIYDNDGVLAGNRVLDGATNDIEFQNLNSFNVGLPGDVDDVFIQGGDAFGPGTGGFLQLSNTATTILQSNNTDVVLRADGSDYNFTTTDAQFTPYPETRDDTGTDAPVNFLYTNGGGNLRSAPLTALPSTNIYNSDGTLTGLRTVDGGGNTIEFDNLFGFFIDNTQRVIIDSTDGAQMRSANGEFSIGYTFATYDAEFLELEDFFVQYDFDTNQYEFQLEALTGDMIITAYPETRDDTGIDTPINFLYTEANGRLRSGPISTLSGSFIGLTDTPATYANPGDVVQINPAGTGLEFAPFENLYTTDGVVASDRTVSGAGNDILWQTFEEFRVRSTTPTSTIRLEVDTPGVNLSNITLGDATLNMTIQGGGGAISYDTVFSILGPQVNLGGAYNEGRDDVGALLPANMLYTNGAGNLLSAPFGQGRFLEDGIWDMQNFNWQIVQGGTILWQGADIIQFTAGAPPTTAFSLNATPGLAEMNGNDMQLSAIDGAGTGQMSIIGDEVEVQVNGAGHVTFPNTTQGSDDTAGTPLQTLTYAGPAGEHLAANATQLLAYGAGAPVTPPNVAANVASLFVDTTGPSLYFWDGAAWVLIV